MKGIRDLSASLLLFCKSKIIPSGKNRRASSSPLCEAVDVETSDQRSWTTHPVPVCAAESVLPPRGSRPHCWVWAMSSHPTTLLGLVLCLGCTIHTQAGTLPKPSISAEPNSVIPRGQPVTVVCRGPAGAQTFRLESKNKTHSFKHVDIVLQSGASETEARFSIEAFSEVTVVHYHCLYHKPSGEWSERSDILELVVTGGTQRPLDDSNNGGECWGHKSKSLVCASWGRGRRSGFGLGPAPALPMASPVHVRSFPWLSDPCCVRWGKDSCVPGLVLGALLPSLFRPRLSSGPPSSKDEEQRPQQRLSQAVDVLERKAGMATVDGLPEKEREKDTPPRSTGDPEEVTYAQLDHRALTQRTAHAASPQVTEPVAESSTYVAIIRN
nr:leukocyte-associated immunoglobulin-like receptor 1 [Microcebus murinus]